MTNPEQPAVEYRCFNPACGSDQITVGHTGQPANWVYGRCSKCGCQGPSAAYQGGCTVDLSLFVGPTISTLQRELAEAKGERDAAFELLHQTAHALGLNLHADMATNQHLVSRAAYLSDQFTADRYTATETARAQAKKNLDTACMYSRMRDAAESSNAKLREAIKEARNLLLPFKDYGDGVSQAVAYRKLDATQSPEDRS